MADFIAPVLQALVDGLKAMDMQGLDAWGEVRKSWTYAAAAWPPVAAMPRATDFDPEGTVVHEMHGFTIKFGVQSSDPDTITDLAIAYMKAIDAAVQSKVVWPAGVRRVFVSRHDYGVLWAGDGNWAKFPELQLEVEAYEIA